MSDSRLVRFLDPAIRRFARCGFSLAGSMILEVRRRRGFGPRRTPADLLLEDAAGIPGPALVEPVPDWDMLLVPAEIDRDQVRSLARAAARTALDGAGERLLELAHDLPRSLRRARGTIAARPWRQKRSQADDRAPVLAADPAERAAWDRFLTAYDAVAELQAAHQLSPSYLTAEELHQAEVELEDAVAIAGELQVHNIRWILA